MENTIASEANIRFGIKNFSEEAILKAFISTAVDVHFPLACWKLPGEPALHILIDISGIPDVATGKLEDLKRGFFFAPFLNEAHEKRLLLKAGIYYNSTLDFPEIQDDGTVPQFTDKAKKIVKILRKHLEKPSSFPCKYFFSKNASCGTTSKEEYKNLVKNSIQSINNGDFEKVVVSRNKRIEIRKGFDLISSFLSLSKKYTNAFVSLVSIPDVGTWIGATPETLIRIDSQNTFFTESLAGTQQLNPGQSVSDVTWTQKEIEEQALVSRYIINCFKEIRLREFEEIGPRTIIAGNLLHLRTIYKVDTGSAGFPNLGTTMLQLLHPTSAVCGMPKKPALDFILKHEKHERSYYSGFLGP
ncbi:MAG: chorismate-binding protein, partial [Bacteroidota bacterium]|nr:chorismate-binding protein [Bacteroidota bacterium]